MSISDGKSALSQRAGVALAVAAGVVAIGAPSASAAAGTETQCGGSLSRAPTQLEPNLLNYQFNCDWGITAYTIVVNRESWDFATMDDFSPAALALDPSGNPLSTVSFTCEGVVPGNGVSCNTGSTTTWLPAPDYAQGQVDTTNPYCSSVPPGSPKGTKAEPQAVVQLIVSDTNGAEAGPFRLNLQPACPPPPKPKKAKKHNNKPARK